MGHRGRCRPSRKPRGATPGAATRLSVRGGTGRSWDLCSLVSSCGRCLPGRLAASCLLDMDLMTCGLVICGLVTGGLVIHLGWYAHIRFLLRLPTLRDGPWWCRDGTLGLRMVAAWEWEQAKGRFTRGWSREAGGEGRVASGSVAGSPAVDGPVAGAVPASRRAQSSWAASSSNSVAHWRRIWRFSGSSSQAPSMPLSMH